MATPSPARAPELYLASDRTSLRLDANTPRLEATFLMGGRLFSGQARVDFIGLTGDDLDRLLLSPGERAGGFIGLRRLLLEDLVQACGGKVAWGEVPPKAGRHG